MQSAERQIQFSAKSNGVITCFLSLILLIILSLVSVTLESARVAGARFLTESCSRMARDSVMAEYSGALFDRYHVFAYNSRAGTSDEICKVLESKTSYYINRNLQAGNRMMWAPVLQKVQVENYELLTDDKGRVFREEAVEYMRYKGVAVLVENLFSSLGIFQGAKETSKLLETKAVTEEALAEIDGCILELFELVDGFVRDDNGIKQNIWGKVKIKKDYVKKLLAAVPTAESTQINHPELFEAIKKHYVNPESLFSDMQCYLEEYASAREMQGSINKRLKELSTQDFLLHPELKLEQTALEAERLVCVAKEQLAKQKYFGVLHDLQDIVTGCEKNGKKALTVLGLIREKQKLAESKVLQYEDELLAAVNRMDTSLYRELAGGLDTMKQYVGLDAEGIDRIPDIDVIEKTLESNRDVLSRLAKIMESDTAQRDLSGNEKERISEMSSLLSEYSHDGLCFDYSGLYLKAEGKSPTKGLKELLAGGIASLVLTDSQAVSEAVFTGEELPSRMTENQAGASKDFPSGSLSWIDADSTSASSVLAFINEKSPFSEVTEWIAKEAEILTEKLLFLSYLKEHFSEYINRTEQTSAYESVLEYEQEFILCGNSKDAMNLYEIIGKILLVRMVFNLIHVLSDSEKCGIAGETALGLLGVTGLPILVNVMKFLILFVWAAEAAFVETAALLQGKRLALIPTKSRFPVSFSELLLMTETRIQQKAEDMQEQKEMAFGYSEYLLLFLLLQSDDIQTMRVLDLIQGNIGLEENGFRVSCQVRSFSVHTEYFLPELFTALPFSKRKTGGYVF